MGMGQTDWVGMGDVSSGCLEVGVGNFGHVWAKVGRSGRFRLIGRDK